MAKVTKWQKLPCIRNWVLTRTRCYVFELKWRSVFFLDWSGSQAAELCHPKVCESAADQEWKEDHSFRASWWIIELHWRERRGSGLWFRTKGSRCRRYSRCPIQDRQGCQRVSFGHLQGQERAAQILDCFICVKSVKWFCFIWIQHVDRPTFTKSSRKHYYWRFSPNLCSSENT